MGWWKWVSILLITYSLVLIVPYILFGGGSHQLGGTTRTGQLAGCRFALGADVGEAAISITAKVDPACASVIEQPTVELLNTTGDVVASAALRGNPNALVARLRLDRNSDTAANRLVLKSKALDGSQDRRVWLLSDLTP